MHLSGPESRLVAARVVVATALAALCFAGNSILCRMALGAGKIDPTSFTAVRLASGAAMLAIVVGVPRLRRAKGGRSSGDWVSGFLLFAYAFAFSLAYVGMAAGAGALVLFGLVQATMVVGAMIQGHRPRAVQWFGLALALGGVMYLASPGLSAPPLGRALLMGLAGISWGLYSFRGRTVDDPFGATMVNFLWAVPFAVISLAFATRGVDVTAHGIVLAAVSGAITSGLGYCLWYAALPVLGAFRGAIVQLAVPVLAASGGILFLNESLSLRLVLASAATLGGVALAVLARPRNRADSGTP